MPNEIERETKPARLLLGFICLVIFAIGFLAIGISTALDLAIAYDARSWPIAEAEVQESSLRPFCDKNQNFEPKIRYSYRVQLSSYSANRIDFAAGNCLSQEAAEAILRQFRVGQKITIHFNPNAPDHAAVDVSKAPTGVGWAAMVASTVIFALSSIGAVAIFPKVKAAIRR